MIPIVKEFIFSKRKAGNKPSFHYDFLLDEYDLFDDYLEMVIQFGVSAGIQGWCIMYDAFFVTKLHNGHSTIYTIQCTTHTIQIFKFRC